MAKKKTILNNPLDAVIPEANGAEVATALSPSTVPSPVKKERLTVHLPVELINRVKNCVYWNPKLNLARFGEAAFLQLLKEYERENGGTYPQREEELRGGRPMK